MSDIVKGTVNWIWTSLPTIQSQQREVEKVIVREIKEMLPNHGRNFIRLAGFSGAMAVILGAYGAHVFKPGSKDDNLKQAFDTANRYHMIHSVALLAVPFTNRPRLVGTLLTSGMVIFCGSCYYHAITENLTIRKITPYGGMLLIIGWAAIML